MDRTRKAALAVSSMSSMLHVPYKNRIASIAQKQKRAESNRMSLISASQQKRLRKNAKRRHDMRACYAGSYFTRDMSPVISSHRLTAS